jgi:hypothetical protein
MNGDEDIDGCCIKAFIDAMKNKRKTTTAKE